MAENSLAGKDPVTVAYHQLGSVEFLRTGAYVNLNDIAKTFGKRLDNWTRLQGTKDLFEAFRQDPAYGGAEPLKTVVGRQFGSSLTSEGAIEGEFQGTWAHPDIAIDFARWCSPAFSLWCNRQIRHLLAYGEVNLNYREWSSEQHQQGIELNREDMRSLYGWRS